MKRWLTVTEAAELLEIADRTVRYWCKQGIIPAERIGSTWRIRTSVLRRRYPGIAEDAESARAPASLLRHVEKSAKSARSFLLPV